MLAKKFVTEFIGTAILVAAIVGSSIMGSNLTNDSLTALLVNALSTVLVLAVLIQVLGPISGAHFNPAVSLAMLIQRKLPLREFIGYLVSQILGAISGALVANSMFNQQILEISRIERFNFGIGLGESLATGLLIFVILSLVKAGYTSKITWAVPAVIGSAYFFTSSTSFANPAVTIGRVFTGSASGIAPESVLGFVIAQLIGMAIALIAAKALEPREA